jgi:hypothetical protein
LDDRTVLITEIISDLEVSMPRDYSPEMNEFWPTIMLAWKEHAEKRPVVECDLANKTVAAYPAKEYIDALSERTRETTHIEFDRIIKKGGIMVFIRDNKNRIIQSYTFSSSELGQEELMT